MKILKIILLIVTLLFINTVYANTKTRVIKVYNNTDETLEIRNAANITQIIPPFSSLEAQQFINVPNGYEQCRNFSSTHTYTVTAKLLESGASFQETYKLGCLQHTFYIDLVPVTHYSLGYLDPMVPPICKANCGSVKTSYAVANLDKHDRDDPFYDILKFTVTK